MGFVGFELALSSTHFGQIGSFTSCKLSNLMEHVMAPERFWHKLAHWKLKMAHMQQLGQVKNVSFTEKRKSFGTFLLLYIFVNIHAP